MSQAQRIVVAMSATLIALLAAIGTSSGQSTVCAGIADCVVAPASPAVVIVSSLPTSYAIACPDGRTPAGFAASTQPGVLATWTGSPDDSYTPVLAATVPAAPAITATTNVASSLTGGTNGSTPSFYLNAVLEWGTPAVVAGLASQGSTTTPGEQGGAVATSATGATFSASVPAGMLTTGTYVANVGHWNFLLMNPSQTGTSWTFSFTNGWGWTTAATMTPSVGCVPMPAPRRKTALHRVDGDRAVGLGRMKHWLRCPTGTTRIGGIDHAVYVPGRSRLTVVERRAIASRLVRSAAGGQHVETRLGSGAPDGVRVQLHATCRG